VRRVFIGLFIWAQIDDQRQCSFVTGYPGRPPGFHEHEDIPGSLHAGRHQRVANGGQTVPRRLSRSVIDSAGPAGADFARNADSALLIRWCDRRGERHRIAGSADRMIKVIGRRVRGMRPRGLASAMPEISRLAATPGSLG
jgi:hypothetical protein